MRAYVNWHTAGREQADCVILSIGDIGAFLFVSVIGVIALIPA